MRPIDYSCYAGAGVFLSTPSDLVRFAMAMNSGKLLQPATVELLQTSQRLASGQETGYGLGWDLKTVTLAGKQTRVVGHDGDSLGGMVASFMTFPEYGIVVAVTSNISYADTFSLAVKSRRPSRKAESQHASECRDRRHPVESEPRGLWPAGVSNDIPEADGAARPADKRTRHKSWTFSYYERRTGLARFAHPAPGPTAARKGGLRWKQTHSWPVRRPP